MLICFTAIDHFIRPLQQGSITSEVTALVPKRPCCVLPIEKLVLDSTEQPIFCLLFQGQHITMCLHRMVPIFCGSIVFRLSSTSRSTRPAAMYLCLAWKVHSMTSGLPLLFYSSRIIQDHHKNTCVEFQGHIFQHKSAILATEQKF